MAYWWVSQNQTYKHERDGGYLWAPKLNKIGRPQHHWTAMTRVQPGDVIFSYVRRKILAVSTAECAAQNAPRPAEFVADDVWDGDGWRVDARYTELEIPIGVPDMVEKIQPLLPNARAPLTRQGDGVQGYLFSLPPRVGRFILSEVDRLNPALMGRAAADAGIIENIGNSDIPETQRTAIVQSRIGQGQFRRDLLKFWDGQCAVTGLNVATMLRASHIKPWRDSNNSERLDVSNGLMLSVGHDAAFDSGLVTFRDSGAIILSSAVPPSQLEHVGIRVTDHLRRLTDDLKPFLSYHRVNVFEP